MLRYLKYRLLQNFTQNIDSDFIAVGLFKEKSSCINLTLKDKLGNFYSTKVFLKDIDNPIVQAFCNKEIIFKDDVNFLKLAYFKKNAVVILPLISVNKCIGVLIIEDNYARQNITLYNLIANFSALYSHNLELKDTLIRIILHFYTTIEDFKKFYPTRFPGQKLISKSFL